MAQAMVKIKDAKLNKKLVVVNEQYKIIVEVIDLTADSGEFQLAFRLGTERGTVKA